MLQIEASENMRLLFKIDSLGNLLLRANRPVDTVFVRSDSVYITKDVVRTEYVEVPAKLKKWDARLINIGKACILILIGMVLYVVGRIFIDGKIKIKLK